MTDRKTDIVQRRADIPVAWKAREVLVVRAHALAQRQRYGFELCF